MINDQSWCTGSNRFVSFLFDMLSAIINCAVFGIPCPFLSFGPLILTRKMIIKFPDQPKREEADRINHLHKFRTVVQTVP